MSKFVVIVEFEIERLRYEEFLTRVSQQARDSVGREEGCHQFDVCANADECAVVLYEVYSDRPAFDLHLGSDHFRSFDNAVSTWTVSKTVRTLGLKASAK